MSDIKEVAKLKAEIRKLEEWRNAVREAAIVSWACDPDVGTPREVLDKVICYENVVALDPLVSEDARKLKNTYRFKYERLMLLIRKIADCGQRPELCSECWTAIDAVVTKPVPKKG